MRLEELADQINHGLAYFGLSRNHHNDARMLTEPREFIHCNKSSYIQLNDIYIYQNDDVDNSFSIEIESYGDITFYQRRCWYTVLELVLAEQFREECEFYVREQSRDERY